MKTRLLGLGAVLTAFWLYCGIALAQDVTTGAIEGKVVDTQGVALPGVTIQVSSPQGTKTEVTDQNGVFRFPYLGVGAYGLKAMLEGYNTVERQDLDVRLGSRVRVEITMTPGGTEEINVIGTAPVVDLSTTTTGATIRSELMSSVPVGRNFSSTLSLAPGVVGGGIPGAGDSNPSINGASGLENTYIVDGVNIGSTGFGSAGSFSYVFGALGTGVNFDYIKEIQVKTGGYEPEFGEALGGYVNLVTKTGTNEVTGSFFTYYQAEDLEGSRATTDRVNAAFDDVGDENTDFGFEIGGPVVRDKAFWFAAFDPTFVTRTRRTPQATREALGFDHTMQSTRTIYNYAGNAKWLVNPKHTLSVSAFGDPSTGTLGPQRDDALTVENPSTKFSELHFGGHNVTGRWEGELLPSWFAEGSVSYHRDEFKEDLAINQPQGTIFPADPNAVPINYGGVGFFTNSESWNLQYRLKLSNFVQAAGEHNFRYGVEFQDIHYDNTTSYSGAPGTITLPDGRVSTSGFQWYTRPDTTVAGDAAFVVGRVRVDELTAKTKARYTAFYVSDSWSYARWLNIMAGVRYEQETLLGTLSDFTWDGNWAPRVHVTVDPTRDNKSKLSFAFGRSYGKVPQDLAVRAMSSEVTAVVEYPITNVDLSDPNNPRILDPNNTLDFFTFGDVPTTIDPDAKLTYQDEYVVSAEREVLPFFNVGVSYTNRRLGRTLEDVALSTYTGILQPDSLDTNGDGAFDAINPAHEDFGNYYITNPTPDLGFPKPSRKYDAVTLKLDKRLHDNWQLLGSYTWSKLRGNYEGYFRRENGQPDPFITSLFDFPYLKNRQPGGVDVNADGSPVPLDTEVFKYLVEDGKLLNDHPHVFNLYGSYAFDFKLNAGLSVRVASGVPKTKLGWHEVYSNGNEIPLEPRGASGRTPTTTDIGLHMDYPLTFSGSRIDLIFDVFNLFNQQKELDYEHGFERGGAIHTAAPVLESGASPFHPEYENPDFGKPVVFQAPRQIRFAARSRF